MRPFLFPAICILTLFSCSTANKKPSFLNSNNLPSHFIELEVDKAHRLRSPKGAELNIPAGAFRTNSKTVQLELKEAYTMPDILAAGLQTRSDGKLLQSGGMIYLNAKADGKDIELAKQIGITIPSATYDANMQLFKGEVQADSSINWTDPKPLTDTAPKAARLVLGEKLFKVNCASCHKIANPFVGPPLAGATNRYSRAWLYRFIANPALMMSYDCEAQRLMKQWKPTMMTSFPQLQKDDIDAILDYADNEAKLRGINIPPPVAATISDSSKPCDLVANDCYDTLFYRRMTDDGIVELDSDTGLLDMGDLTMDTSIKLPAQPPYFPPGAYSFYIDQTGWYNIDKFYNQQNSDLSPVQLLAITSSIEANLDVYLCIPKRKVLTTGYYEKENNYIFYKAEDEIDLPLNEDAIIFVTGSNESGVYYGISKFRIQQQQNIPVQIKPITKEKLLEALRKNGLDGVSLEAEENEMRIEKKDCDSPQPATTPV